MRQTRIVQYTSLLLVVTQFASAPAAFAVGGQVDPVSLTEIACPQYGMAVEQAVGKMWDLRKNGWAMLTMPKKARRRNFNIEAIESYRDKLIDSAKKNLKVALPVNAEEKIGAYFAMMELNAEMRTSMVKLFSELEPKRKKEAYKQIMNIMNDFTGDRRILGFIPKWRMNPYARQNRVLKIQQLMFESFYPKIFEGMNKETAAYTAEMISRARFTHHKLTNVLTEMTDELGLKDQAVTITAFLNDNLMKGNSSAVAMSIYTNMSGFLPRVTEAASMITGWVVPAFPIVPKTSLAHWVHIPNEMWNEAMEVGFDKAWENSIKPYVMKKYGALINIDTVRYNATRAYTSVAYTWLYAAIGVGIYTEYKLIKEAQRVLNDNEIPGGTDENGKKVEPKKISKEDLDEGWQNWLKSNPGAKPGDENYDAAHGIFFDDEEK